MPEEEPAFEEPAVVVFGDRPTVLVVRRRPVQNRHTVTAWQMTGVRAMPNAELMSARPAWADDSSTLFASRVWFERWFEAFGPAEHGQWDSPDGVSPYGIAYQIERRRVGPLTLRVVSGAVNSYTPQFDVLGSGAPSRSDLTQMMKELGASVLVLPLVARNSRLLRALDSSAFRMGTFLDDCEAAPLIDCTGSWDAYLATRRPSQRSEWRDKERRLLKAGGRLEVLSSWEDASSVFDDLLSVEASGWKGRNGTSIRQVPQARTFFEGICRDLASARKLRVFLLRFESRVIAFKICTLHAGRLSSLKAGYSEEFAKYSPGVVLQLWVSKWCFEQPDVDIFDFLGPATANKLAWATRVEELYTLYVFRPTLSGALAWLRWSAGPRIRQWFRRTAGGSPADQAATVRQQSAAQA